MTAELYLMQHSCSLQGAILSGSNYQPLPVYQAASLITRFERWRLGPTGRSRLIDFLSFGSFNKAFKPNRTPYDWLSRDPAQVDAYASDPLCGFRCTNQLWIDLLGGLQQISKASNLAQIDPGLPILVMGGECDPVSEGKRLTHLAQALQAANASQDAQQIQLAMAELDAAMRGQAAAVKAAKLKGRLLDVAFEDWKGGRYKIISFYAKRARGLMARHAITHGVQEVEALKAFDSDGYAFAAEASDDARWVFRRRQD